MSEIHPHVGAESPAWAHYSLVCVYSGVTPDGPLCGKPATTHVRWTDGPGDAIASSACDLHAEYARTYGILDEHPTADSACCMPGSIWIDGPPSRCVIDDSGVEPELIGERELVSR